MNFLKKIGNLFSKMTSSRKNEKLVEALKEKPKSKEDPVQDIEDLIKTQYSSPLQTRSQRLKGVKLQAITSLASATSTNIKLKAIPLLKSEGSIITNRDLNVKPRDKEVVRDVKPGISSEAAAQVDDSHIHNLGLETVPNKSTILEQLSQPTKEINKKTVDPLNSKHEECVPFTLIPPSNASVEETVNAKIDAKATRKEKVKRSVKIASQSAASKLPEPTASSADDKSPKAKTKRKTKTSAESKEKLETSKDEKTVPKKRTTKKEVKAKKESDDEPLEQKLMPIPPNAVKSNKEFLKLTAFKFDPQKINRPSKTEENVEEIKEETKRKRASPLKSRKISDSEPEIKVEKWQPDQWTVALENIKQMRALQEAPVDEMGCHKCCDENADEKTQRFQTLVALMLSSQTRDQITYEVMQRLRENTCTPASIVEMDPEKLMEILLPVSFYKNKTKYLQNTSRILMERYDSDIPNNVKELIKLPGVGPKMAHICMSVAWDLVTGIGVDTHVHRISNRLGWVKNSTKEPEQTRKQLEHWLPQEYWKEVNYLLVGFGQTFCTPVRPKCHECLNNAFCPSANAASPSPKGKVKKEKGDVS